MDSNKIVVRVCNTPDVSEVVGHAGFTTALVVGDKAKSSKTLRLYSAGRDSIVSAWDCTEDKKTHQVDVKCVARAHKHVGWINSMCKMQCGGISCRDMCKL